MLSVFKARLILGSKILWNDTPFLERELRRLKIVLSKEIYKERLDAIDRANTFFGKVSVWAGLLSPHGNNVASRIMLSIPRSLGHNPQAYPTPC